MNRRRIHATTSRECSTSYMIDHVLLNLLNELRKRDKIRGLAEHFITFSQRDD